MLSPEQQVEVANNLKAIGDDAKDNIEVDNVEVVRPLEIVDSYVPDLDVSLDVDFYFLYLFPCEVSLTIESWNWGLGNMSVMREGRVELFEHLADVARVEVQVQKCKKEYN